MLEVLVLKVVLVLVGLKGVKSIVIVMLVIMDVVVDVVVTMLRSEYLMKCLIETPLVITTRETRSGVVTRYTANYYTPGYYLPDRREVNIRFLSNII